ncbi:hypothetical protein [Acaryochloris sp. CCMEE 5410]|uniref:hypothetical protein n=1 Tax=Acaryochloris sp. CCMEE 5410 TaxID=310037 RepID=UPI0021D20689|nr:hypothetical protein [Acaryochloris sp. CCMEE 5410]
MRLKIRKLQPITRSLIPLVQHDIAERCQVVQAYAPLFDDLALDMNRWKSALSVTRPPEFYDKSLGRLDRCVLSARTSPNRKFMEVSEILSRSRSNHS